MELVHTGVAVQFDPGLPQRRALVHFGLANIAVFHGIKLIEHFSDGAAFEIDFLPFAGQSGILHVFAVVVVAGRVDGGERVVVGLVIELVLQLDVEGNLHEQTFLLHLYFLHLLQKFEVISSVVCVRFNA